MLDAVRPLPDQQPLTARAHLVRVAQQGVIWAPTGAVGDATRPAAVLVLFGVLDGLPAHHDAAAAVPADLDVLLVQRASSLNHHPGQIAFPGGRLDPEDDGPVAAALREAEEETGLDPAGVDVLGTLGQLPLPISNHLVTPVLGWWARPTAIGVVDEAESAAVFRVAVADLLDPANRRTAGVTRGRQTFRSPAFVVGPRIVWGFTGLVLDQLFDALGWTEPWDRDQRIEIPV